MAQDSDAAPVALVLTDGYCLNGNRLRLTSGSYGYGGSTYQTELANFSRVTAVGAAGNGPASFTEERKDGLIFTYGNTADSQVLASGTSTAHTWMLNEIRDRSGNKVIFTYKTPNGTTTGTTHLVKVQWTATSAGASTYVYSMDFAFGANVPATSIYGYIAGTEVRDTDLLNAITVSESGTVKRNYVLTYETSPTTGGRRLTTVLECSDAAASNCLSPTTIGYQNGVTGANTSSVALNVTGTLTNVKAGYDFNGDGILDMSYRKAGQWYARIGSPAGYSAELSIGISDSALITGDLLGNGRTQILKLVGSSWYTYAWNGSAFVSSNTGLTTSSVPADAVLADVDADGRDDLVYVSGITYSDYTLSTRRNLSSGGTLTFSSPVTVTMAPPNNVSLPPGLYWVGALLSVGVVSADLLNSPSAASKMDLNADGREDLYISANFQLCAMDPFTGEILCDTTAEGSYYLQSYPGFQYASVPVPLFPPPSIDFNGDGCRDSLTSAQIYISGCNGTSVATITLGAPAVGTANWDGDGRKDILVLPSGATTLKVMLSLGNSASAQVETGIPANVLCQAVMTDTNGDGLDEMGCYQYNTSLSLYFHNGATITPDLATSFTDGYGVTFGPSYGEITQGSYTAYTNAVYPQQDVTAGMRIVKNVVASDGIGSTFTRTYTYFGATRNLQGRGLEGFEQVKVVDSRTGAYTIDFYRRDFPYTGALIKSEAYQSGGTLISRQNVALNATVLDATTNNQRHFVFSPSGDSSSYEVGGTANGLLIQQTAESRTYDSWGNLAASTNTVTDMDISSLQYGQYWTETSSLTISPDTGTNWCLGLSTTSSVTFSASNGEPSVTRAKGFTPDYIKCRVTEEIVEPASSNRRVATTYGFDSFGNPNSISIVGRNPNGTNMAARTTSLNWGSTGQFPVSDTNPLTQTTQRTYNATFGQLATQTDPNNIVVQSNQFDTFGRVQRSTRADGTSTYYTYAACATYGCQNGDPGSGATGINKMIVIASERDTSDVQVRDDWTYLDQFDRPIVQKATTLSGGYSRVGRQYDVMGQTYRETAPCDAVSCTAYWVTNAFDLVGRLISQSRPQSQSISTPVTTTFAYAGRTQTVNDPQSKVTTRVLDVGGRMRRSQDHNGYYQVFAYDAAGSLKLVTDSLSNQLFTANYSYGVGAFQDSSADMDLGARAYTYNSLAELTAWTDAKAQSFSMGYDALSRPITRTENGVTSTWTWGASAGSYNIGQLASVSVSGYSESNTFDNKGRLSAKTIIASQNYSITFAYTTQGRVDTLTFPTSTSSTRVKVKYGYQYGTLKTVTDFTTGSAGTVYWTATSQNPRGQTTQESLGNGIVTTRAIDAVTGWMASVQSGVGGGAGVQNQSYLFDLVGNVTQRQENNLGKTENFYYDNLYRLTSSQLNSVTNLSVNYDAMGNITSRSDVNAGATWTYDTTKKHAVKTAGAGLSYNYDLNGNMTSRNGSTIGWTAYNYPSSLAAGSESTSFSYTPDRRYYKQVYTGPGGTETTHYIGGILEKVALPGGITDWRHYVYAEGQAVAIVSRKSSGTNSVSYPLEDHQGSASVLTNASGGSIVKESFTAFGAPRNGATWSGAVPSGDKTLIAGISRRGYTFHSMLGDMGLIHMNGRVQDAVTGRFLSPDPYVTQPGNTQSFNRYAYVNNNPLSYIDPSGFRKAKPKPATDPPAPDPPANGELPAINITGTHTPDPPPPASPTPAFEPPGNLNQVLQPPDGVTGTDEELEEVVVAGERTTIAQCARPTGSLWGFITNWLAKHTFEINFSAGGLGTFGGLLGRTDGDADNAQIVQSQIFVNTRGQVGYRSTVDTATAIGPAFVLTNALGGAVSGAPQRIGYSTSTSAHLEVNTALVAGINLDWDSNSAGTSFRIGGDIGDGINLTAGDTSQQQWATAPVIGSGTDCP